MRRSPSASLSLCTLRRSVLRRSNIRRTRILHVSFWLVAGLMACLFAIASPLLAQQAPALVTQTVNNSVRTVLPNNVHPLARPEFDQGEAPADLVLHRMMLVLKRSDQQETTLRRLIENQQIQEIAKLSPVADPGGIRRPVRPRRFRHRRRDQLAASQRLPGLPSQQRPHRHRVLRHRRAGQAGFRDGDSQVRRQRRATLGQRQQSLHPDRACPGRRGSEFAAQLPEESQRTSTSGRIPKKPSN